MCDLIWISKVVGCMTPVFPQVNEVPMFQLLNSLELNRTYLEGWPPEDPKIAARGPGTSPGLPGKPLRPACAHATYTGGWLICAPPHRKDST